MWETEGGPRSWLFVCGNFVQTNLAFFLRQEARSSGNAGSNISGSRLPAAATFLVTFGSQEAQYGGVLDSFRRGLHFQGWQKGCSFTKAALCFSLVAVGGK